jgi:hypothetical protein
MWAAVADGDGSASLSWLPVSGATHYEVRFGTTPGLYTKVRQAGSATNLYVGGLRNGLQYYFVVLAANNQLLSLPSPERGVIPVGIG